jgi:hypothetical protein
MKILIIDDNMGIPEPNEKAQEALKREAEIKTNKPETREQRRWRERLNVEVNQMLSSLQDKFIAFFMACENPEGEEVVEKMKDYSAKWKFFCKKKKLIPMAIPIMDDFMTNCINDYRTEKALQEAELQKAKLDELSPASGSDIATDESSAENPAQ